LQVFGFEKNAKYPLEEYRKQKLPKIIRQSRYFAEQGEKTVQKKY
jgi:hypothetical protein